METVAIYHEAKPRIYGFITKKGLSLINLSLRTKQLTAWGENLHSPDREESKFIMVVALPIDREFTRLCVLVDSSQSPPPRELLQGPPDGDFQAHIETESPAEMICFHGPHFGDRYGIADAFYTALEKQGIQILTASCTGATVQLVVAEGESHAAIEALSTAFATPTQGAGQ